MEEKTESRYCQSCGMPIDLLKTEYLGTNTDKSSSDSYCYYCLKDGEYIVDYSMKQMINVWVKYTDKYNIYADTNHSPTELEEILSKRLPELKRWKQKKETQNIHSEIINHIQTYINKHLFNDLSVELLSKIACLSPHHFRRVFHCITSENVGAYIQRLRLEYIAYKLVSTDLSITQLIDKTAVYTKSSLSKAFKKHFKIAPSAYKKQYSLINNHGASRSKSKVDNIAEPRIERINQKQIIGLQVRDSNSNMQTYTKAWNDLLQYLKNYNLKKNQSNYVSLSLDEPYITSRPQCRFYLGVFTNIPLKPIEKLIQLDIPAGLYAIFTHKGEYSRLPDVYKDIYQNWFPACKYIQNEPLTFEIYLNTPREVPAENLLTEIFIPIIKKPNHD